MRSEAFQRISRQKLKTGPGGQVRTEGGGYHVATINPCMNDAQEYAHVFSLMPECIEALGTAVSAIQELYHFLPKNKRERVLYYGDQIGKVINKLHNEETTK